jgi:hypothetical protein
MCIFNGWTRALCVVLVSKHVPTKSLALLNLIVGLYTDIIRLCQLIVGTGYGFVGVTPITQSRPMSS